MSSDEAGSILGSPMDRSETATTRGGTSQKTLDQLKKRRKSHSLLSVPPGGVMTRNNTESSTSISVKEWRRGRWVIFVLLIVLCDILSFTDLVWYLKSFFVYCFNILLFLLIIKWNIVIFTGLLLFFKPVFVSLYLSA